METDRILGGNVETDMRLWGMWDRQDTGGNVETDRRLGGTWRQTGDCGECGDKQDTGVNVETDRRLWGNVETDRKLC